MKDDKVSVNFFIETPIKKGDIVANLSDGTLLEVDEVTSSTSFTIRPVGFWRRLFYEVSIFISDLINKLKKVTKWNG